MDGYSYTITAKTPSGTNYSLSNYIDCTKGNGIYSLYEMIENANGDANRAIHLLNTNNRTYAKFSLFRVFKNGFILRAEDYCGNKTFVTVKKGA